MEKVQVLSERGFVVVNKQNRVQLEGKFNDNLQQRVEVRKQSLASV